jgi:glutathione S-transferase
MPQLKLTYFDIAGRAEPIRLALRISGIPFVDHRLKFPEFGEAKAAGALPLGAVPVLEVDGVTIAQTGAILRYVAHLGDGSLYPTDPWAALVVDSVLDSFNDTLSHALMPSMFERDMAKKLAMRAEIAAGPMARVFAYTERLLQGSGGPFVAGAALSIADLVVAQQVRQIQSGTLDGLGAAHLEPYPGLVALTAAFLAEPRIAALG